MTGQWINVKFACQTRPVLYQVLLKLMNAQEDLVVRNDDWKKINLSYHPVQYFFFIEDQE